MQAFTLDPASSIPVKTQLIAQVRYQILAGLLRPGDQLPPLRDLAAGLGVHLNTVVRAFDELAAAGYLHTHQGKGVFVAEEFPGQGQGAALRSLLAGVFQSARQFDMGPEEIALATLAHGQLARAPSAAPNRLLLVGGARPHLRRIQGELEAALPALVVPVLADELPDRVRTGEFNLVACTLFHAVDVRQHLPRAAAVVLADADARDGYTAVQALPDGAPVAIAAADWLHAARIRRSAEYAGLSRLSLSMAVGNTAAALAPALAEARAVLAATSVAPQVREARPGVLLVAEPTAAPTDAVALLRKGLPAPAATPGMQMRSAWV
jgi:DNA-binding transcriptional regulator YhcF (GntR family)